MGMRGKCGFVGYLRGKRVGVRESKCGYEMGYGKKVNVEII